MAEKPAPKDNKQAEQPVQPAPPAPPAAQTGKKHPGGRPKGAKDKAPRKKVSKVKNLRQSGDRKSMPKPQVMLMDNSAESMLNNLVARQLADPNFQVKIPKSEHKVLGLLQDIVGTFQTGGDISEYKEQVQKLIHNQAERADLVDNVLMTIDYERLGNAMASKIKLEMIIHAAIASGQISTIEAIALFPIVSKEAESLLKRVKLGTSEVKDVSKLVEKVNSIAEDGNAEILKQFANTSPQNREIMRRMAHKFGKIVKDVQKEQKTPQA
jgi:hypothetical protein